MNIEEGGGASQSTDPAAGTSTATDVSLREYFWALRAADQRLFEERDRRYAEVDIEKEKALKIKETADLAALSLAREIQDYKDEKANNLRTQIESERGDYARNADLRALSDKLDAQIAPLLQYVAGQQGRTQGLGLSANVIATVASIVIAALILYTALHK